MFRVCLAAQNRVITQAGLCFFLTNVGGLAQARTASLPPVLKPRQAQTRLFLARGSVAPWENHGEAVGLAKADGSHAEDGNRKRMAAQHPVIVKQGA